MIKDIHEIKECPDCASTDIVYNDRRQQVVCGVCGLIYEPLTPKEEETYLNPTLGEKAKAEQSRQVSPKKKQTPHNSKQK